MGRQLVQQLGEQMVQTWEHLMGTMKESPRED